MESLCAPRTNSQVLSSTQESCSQQQNAGVAFSETQKPKAQRLRVLDAVYVYISVSRLNPKRLSRKTQTRLWCARCTPRSWVSGKKRCCRRVLWTASRWFMVGEVQRNFTKFYWGECCDEKYCPFHVSCCWKHNYGPYGPFTVRCSISPNLFDMLDFEKHWKKSSILKVIGVDNLHF